MDVEPGHFANQAPQENREIDLDRNIVQIEQYLKSNLPLNGETFDLLIQIGIKAINTLKIKNAALIKAQSDLYEKDQKIKDLEVQILYMKSLHEKEIPPSFLNSSVGKQDTVWWLPRACILSWKPITRLLCLCFNRDPGAQPQPG